MNPTATSEVLGEVENARPLRARDGLVMVAGWCFVQGEAVPPAVRLRTAAGMIEMSGRITRPDLTSLHPGEKSALTSGFVIKGTLPAGVHLACFEACTPDGEWRCFKTLSLVVEPQPFTVAVERPTATSVVTERVHVEGWALHERETIQELTLRYGHQQIICDTGRLRPDLSDRLPLSPHAARAGFKSRTILSAGRGDLRFKARFQDGSIAIARTSLKVDIATDENHGADLDLSASRVPLVSERAASSALATSRTARSLRVLFILPGSFASNSALHAAALANELAASGHTCAIAVPHDLETLAHHHSPAFHGLLHAAARAGAIFANGKNPEVIHAWTTRENVRQLTEELRQRCDARVIVHLEDNEQQVLASHVGRPFSELEKLSASELAALVPADLAHPHRSRDFLTKADGVTLINERLAEFVPSDRPRHLLWPAADSRYFNPRELPAPFRRLLNRRPADTVLFYHGNVHAANAAEVRELYAAVLRLNHAGHPVTLIRSGLDSVDFLGPLAPELAPHVLALGQILHHRHLPPLMALADIFVQPGVPDAFNDYRFPSKLPEFFAIGRPVVLPRTNLGTVVRHGEDAYVLDRADAAGIAAAVTELRGNPALREKLSRGALAFAAEHFSWRRSAESLEKFYLGLLPAP